ncbi:MAG: DUF6603 domain-containing protein [Gemmatimonadaceae bacterium]
MAESRHTFEVIARHLIGAATPLIEAGTSLGAFMRLMARLGFRATSIPAPYVTLATDVRSALKTVETFPVSPSLDELLDLLLTSKRIFDGIQNLRTGPVPAGVPPAPYAAEIGDRLFELLLTDYLAREAGAAFNLLASLNVVRLQTVSASASRPSFIRTQFNWGELPKVISSPGDLPARVYKWGTPDFDLQRVLDDLAGLFLGLRFPVVMRESTPEIASGYLGISEFDLPPLPKSFELPFFFGRAAGKSLEASFVVRPLPAQGGALPGIVLEPRIPSALPLEVQLHPKVKMRVRAGTNAGTLFGLIIRPGQVSIRYPLAPGTPPPSAGIGVGFDFTPGTPVVLLGDPTASRIEFASAKLDLGADVGAGGVSLTLAAELNGLKVVLDSGDGDSFIQKVIGLGKTEVTVPLGIEWSQANGIRFKGSAAFEVALHPHLQLGPVRVDDLTVKVSVPSGAPPRVQLAVGASIAGDLGPLKFVVRGIGLRAEASFAPGNAGPLGISLGFKPPTGVGLELNAGGFVGGGFLDLDPEKGEYAGGLELTFLAVVSVRAIGILSTRLPDGSEGFSLLIIIVAEFPPLQLSWGFTLVGVGGLLGLNRTVLLEQLQNGVHDGSLNSILFPTDIVANSARIIGDLKRVFPARDGRFLVGPMAKLGWGTPTLISLSLGIVLEIPRPMFTLIGVLHMALPADDLPLLHLQVSFGGGIDFEKGELWFDASLFDSRMGTFTLTGDMAVRAYWKESANFLLTVGGFHPEYTPPPMNLPELTRLGVVLFQGNPHVTAQVYFAVTSNSVQLGARVEVYYGIDAFNVYGFLGLDVLINFNPFHFIAEITAEIGVRTGSEVLFAIQLQLLLEGPSPWHARGTGSFRIGFIVKVTIKVGFDITFGDAQETRLAPIDVLGAVVTALGNLGNWRPRLPAASNQHVTLRALPDPATVLVLHPFGALEITQKLVPLHIAIQRFGSRVPDKGSVFTLADVKLGGEDATVTNTREQFAPAQFFAMSDAEKLSRPSFADYDAGIVVGGDLAPRTDFMRVRDVVYELIYLPEHHPVRLAFTMVAELARSIVRGAAVAQSPVSYAQRSPSALAERASLAPERYAVVSTSDLTLHADHLVFDSATAADQAIARLIGDRPELAGAIQMLPASAAVPAISIP